MERVVGLEEDVQRLLGYIFDREKKVIWINGPEGVGKTTLATTVCEFRRVTSWFQVIAWVAVSEEFGPQDIALSLLKEISHQFTLECSMGKLLDVLTSSRCLVVLDGLWRAEALPKVLIYLAAGSKILITTRINRGFRFPGMESQDQVIYKMRSRSIEESLELLKTKVYVPEQLEELGRKLVRKCMGLPPNIFALGHTLSRRAATEDHWLKVLNQVDAFDRNHLSMFKTLDVAADSLPSHLKDWLSSFDVFSDDFDIPMRRLIAYWVAEGHVQQEAGRKEPPEILAEKQLMEFIEQNIIQVEKWKINGRVKTCRMNKLFRDIWLSKAKKEIPLHEKKKGSDSSSMLSCFRDVNRKETSSTSSTATGMITRLADHLDNKEKCFSHIHGDQKISHSSFKQHYGDLCSLVSFDSREGPVPGEAIGSFLQRGIAARCFMMLRVLDLEGVFRPNLPKLIHKLLQLRYIGLRSTYIEELPSKIGKLLNLQTLDLKHTCIKRLPCSLWEMQQLRHIYLSESYRSRIVAPPRTSSLVDFQTLWGAFVDEETPIADGLDRLTNLRKLGLVCRLITSQQEELAEWISKLSHLESLRLRSVNEMVRPSNLYLKFLSGLHKLSSIYLLGRLENPVFVHELPNSLTEITLSSSELVEDPMKKLEKLPKLGILNLYAGSYTGKTMVCSFGGFPLLRVLNLWKLQELEEWTVEEGALVILRDLEIRSCNKFKKIPDGLEQLGACRQLKLTNMPDEFNARVIANQGQDWYKIAHVPSVIIKN